MVLKKCKHGGNTGNTLRNSYKRGVTSVGKASSTSFITRKTDHVSGTLLNDEKRQNKFWIDDGISINAWATDNASLNSNSNVRFSLNKKGRWHLPAHLKETLQEVPDAKEKLSVKRPKKKAKKLKEISNQFSHEKSGVVLLEKPGDWMFANNLRNSCKYVLDSSSNEHARESKKWRANLPTLRCEDKAEIVYTIESSVKTKTNTWCYHNDKRKTYSELKNNKHHRESKNCCKLVDYEENGEVYVDSDITDSEDYCEDAVRSNFKTGGYSLNMFVVDKKHANIPHNSNANIDHQLKRVNPASGQFTKKHDKGSYEIIEVTNCNNEFVSMDAAIEINNDRTLSDKKMKGKSLKKSLEFSLKIDSSQIKCENLKRLFGCQYREGASYPRSFAIFKSTTDLADAAILFTIESEYVDGFSTVNIKTFNSNIEQFPVSEKNFDILNLVNYAFKGLNSVTMKHNHLEKELSSSMLQCFKPKIDLVEFNNFFPDVFDDLNQRFVDNIESQSKTTCPICFSSVVIIHLKKCNHYACKSCLEKYVSTQMNSGYFQLLCPEFQCSNKLDVVTILQLISPQEFSMVIKKKMEAYVLKNESMKFCPNSRCKVVAVNPTNVSLSNKVIVDNPIVRCKCTKNWCFNCQSVDHWPSSCEAFQNYQEQKQSDIGTVLDQNGNLFQVEIVYKKCPFCRNPIVKNGGCNYMSCICGKSFCWYCLKSFAQHTSCSMADDQKMTFTSLDDSNTSSRVVKFQRKAVKYAMLSTGVNVWKTKLKVNKEIRKLNHVPSSSLLGVTNQAFGLLHDCYKLMENLTVACAMSKSKHFNRRAMEFVEGLMFYTGLLKDTLYRTAKICDIVKYIKLVEEYLNKLQNFGLAKKEE
ncbi:uncharacterized protein LOC130641124 [Hydractinia symbiolongicarpus]|uniref:uncharacterized protein LOC130641124 n=1 Tax=Hydractinia symbiolongicarpus TaxID=13093 RepID=UPI00254A4498|nr:uncharacterized protein LOC130641124 [Hydractinia symbiolongicarpus]